MSYQIQACQLRTIIFFKFKKSIYRRGILRKCLLSACSLANLLFSSAVSNPALASAGTNLMLSFSRDKKKVKVLMLHNHYVDNTWLNGHKCVCARNKFGKYSGCLTTMTARKI